MNDRIDELADEIREILIDEGRDPNTVDLQLAPLRERPSTPVGNMADLNRLGGMLHDQSGGIADAFTDPATQPGVAPADVDVIPPGDQPADKPEETAGAPAETGG